MKEKIRDKVKELNCVENIHIAKMAEVLIPLNAINVERFVQCVLERNKSLSLDDMRMKNANRVRNGRL